MSLLISSITLYKVGFEILNIPHKSFTIVGSRRHKDFDEYLVSKEEWELVKHDNTRLAVSNNYEEYIKERKDTLLQRIKWVNENVQTLEGVSLLNGELHVKRLEKKYS